MKITVGKETILFQFTPTVRYRLHRKGEWQTVNGSYESVYVIQEKLNENVFAQPPTSWDAPVKFKEFMTRLFHTREMLGNSVVSNLSFIAASIGVYLWWEHGYNVVDRRACDWVGGYIHPNRVPHDIASLRKEINMRSFYSALIPKAIEYPSTVRDLIRAAHTDEEYDIAVNVVRSLMVDLVISGYNTDVSIGTSMHVFNRFGVTMKELIDYLIYLKRSEAVAVSYSSVCDLARMMYRSNELYGPNFDRYPVHYLSVQQITGQAYLARVKTL
jgi:hypothetical protein